MRLHVKPGLIVAAGAALLLLVVLIWSLDAGSATAQSCGGGYHFHAPDTCHKHCQNGMSSHNTDHGDNCSVSNPTPKPPRASSRREPTPTPTPPPAPKPCPAAVSGFQVDSVTDTSITLAWDAPTSNPRQYKIESCTSGAADCPGATEVATPAGSATTHTLANLNPNTSYYYRITALAHTDGTCQDSAASSIITGTTAKIRLVVDNFRVTTVTSTTAVLEWDAPDSTDGLDKYKIESCTSADASCPGATELATPDKTKTSYTVTDLTPSTTYYFRITALALPDSNYLDSDPSASRGTTSQSTGGGTPGDGTEDNTPSGIVEVTTALPPVAGLSVQCTANSASVTWTSPTVKTNIANLEIQYCTDADCTSPQDGGSPRATATKHDVAGLSPNTNYYFRIRAVGKTGHGDSDWSDTVLCKTGKAPLPAISGFAVDSFTDGGGVPLTWDALTHTALSFYTLEVCANAQCSGTPTSYSLLANKRTHTCQRGSTCYYRVRAKANNTSDYQDGPWSEFVVVSIPN